jgi:hypothetical protein
LALNFILAACGGAVGATPTPTPESTSTPVVGPTSETTPAATSPARSTPVPTQAARTYPEAVLAAIQVLSAATSVAAAQIHVVNFEAVDWPDACLGLAEAGEVCAAVITPGYRVTLRAGEVEYEFHTNVDGSTIRQKPQEAAAHPPAVQAAIKALSEAKGIPADQITVVSVQGVEWSDSCLGVETPGLVCLQVITPGYRILLSAGGEQFEVHTNETGSAVRLAPQP